MSLLFHCQDLRRIDKGVRHSPHSTAAIRKLVASRTMAKKTNERHHSIYQAIRNRSQRERRIALKCRDGLEPLLGIFWCFPRTWKLPILAISEPLSEVAEASGYRSTDAGHAEEWDALLRVLRRNSSCPSFRQMFDQLNAEQYDHWPRGRVTWSKWRPERRFLVLADKKLNRAACRRMILATFRLPPDETQWDFGDDHYSSNGK